MNDFIGFAQFYYENFDREMCHIDDSKHQLFKQREKEEKEREKNNNQAWDEYSFLVQISAFRRDE